MTVRGKMTAFVKQINFEVAVFDDIYGHEF